MDRPWFVLLVALGAAADAFVIFVPIDALLVCAVLFGRKHWIRTFLVIALGSALGALVLAAVVYFDQALITEHLFQKQFHSPEWARAARFIEKHGAVGLSLISVSPIPQQPAVVVAALAKMNLIFVFLAVFVGRLVKYGIFAAIAEFAPQWLMKVPTLRKAIQSVNAARTTAA